MKVGLRIDVDTFRGTRLGVPALCTLLADHGVKATFFFSVGPDNMGRHIWRLLRPAFFAKMLRTRASALYGWDILLKGTLWPGPIIGEKLESIIRAAADAGHEVGLHAWDHHAWQSRLERMDGADVYRTLSKGVELLTRIIGRPPLCSAAPAWKSTDLVLKEKLKFPFAYNSDCRGESIFYPLVEGEALPQPQVPVTLPTYDEIMGRRGICDVNFNDHMLSLLRHGKLNVLTVHAEVEGIRAFSLFQRFLEAALDKGISFAPLGDLIRDFPSPHCSAMVPREIPGREGWVACQGSSSSFKEKN
jgi:undecaprenyl phosphate-alpha-L-ara4FN deformylase